MKYVEDLKVIENSRIYDNIYRMEFESNKIVNLSKPGQFIQIKVCTQTDPLLRRPISIAEINNKNKTLTIYYKVIGKGTELLAKVRKNEIINGIGPLGNGFDIKKKNLNVGIVGGGIGIAPLVELAKTMSRTNRVYSFLGFNSDTYLIDMFKKVSEELYISTVTGIQGHKGFITDIVNEKIEELDIIYACGPKPMLKKITELANKNKIKCQISLEERMACGFGACLGCSIETPNGNMKKVCVDGPVFWCNEVKLDD
jgi:dihydroorotate dehydrogenase electron transfer subunit